MTEPVVINVSPSTQPQTLTIQLQTAPPQWSDLAVYAPTIPGLVVAILGLWVAHKFAVRRDKRKELLDLRDAVKDALTEAEDACTAAWLSAPSGNRMNEVVLARSKLQALGASATELRRRTDRGLAVRLLHVFINCSLSIDILHDVARLRNLATNDPFDDPKRLADAQRASEISASVSEMSARIDQQFHDLYR